MVVNTSKGIRRLGTDASPPLGRLRSSWRDGGRKLAGHRDGGEYLEGHQATGDGRKSAAGKAEKLMEGRRAQAGRPSTGGIP